MFNFLAFKSFFLTKSNYESLKFPVNNSLLYNNKKTIFIIFKDFNFSAISMFFSELLLLFKKLIL